jgi:hypothetical protein
MTKQAYKPAMSDSTVTAKTGKNWKAWFTILDKDGAAKLTHKQIAQLLSEKHRVPDWWCQMVAVEYERARGLRSVHQRPDGFSVSVTKVIPAGVPALFAAVADPARRKPWFPKGRLEVTSQTKDKSVRGRWNTGQRIDFAFYPKGPGKAQIAIQITKLPDLDAMESQRAAWKAAIARLASAGG